MSARPDDADPPDDELLAGELVLGVLDGDQRRQAQARSASDPAFAARISRWEQRLAPWLAEFAPLQVPPHVWPALRRRLGWQDAAPRARFWASLALWRGATAVALVAALALWVTRPAPPPPVNEAALAKPVTTLIESDGRPGWLASVDRARGTVLMVPVPRTPDPAGRVPELWIIPAGQAPRSLGAVSINKAHTVEVPADARAALAAPGSVLAVTLEAPPGLPHAAPAGPVIARGTIQI